MRAVGSLAALVLLALLVLPGASSQVFLSPGQTSMDLEPGEVRTVPFELRNPVNHSLSAFARMEGSLADGATVEPDEFRLTALGSASVDILIEADALEPGEHNGQLSILLVNPETGETQHVRSNLTATVPDHPLLFGQWESPLGPPLDGAIGIFLLETSGWILVAFLAMGVASRGTRLAMRGSPKWLKHEVTSKFTTPLFAVIVLGGLRWAWRVFPDDGLAAIASGLLDALIVLATAFLLYRLTDSLLVYLSDQVAPKTATKWDDVILPVSRKLAIVVLGGFAFFFALQNLGLNLGFLVAGGLIIGLVLSNSLGPTLQNLFSGLFILIDRPFVEGDDIRLDTGEVCNVRRIGLRSTRLYFYRNHELFIVPNKDLENSRIVNLVYPDSRYRIHIVVGVSYGSPIERVKELLFEAAADHPDVLKGEDNEPGVMFDDFGESALLFRLFVYINDVRERFRISSELRDAIDAKFRESGIIIPFPQRTLWHRDLEVRSEEIPEGAEARGDAAE